MFRTFLSGASIPLLGAAIALSSWLLSQIGFDPWAFFKNLPGALSNENLLLFVFICALLETLFPICHYFPGTVIILVAWIAAGSGASPIIWAGVITAGVALGLMINYRAASVIAKWRITQQYAALMQSIRNFRNRYGIIAELILASHPNNIGLMFFLYGLSNVSAPVSMARATIGTFIWFSGYLWVGAFALGGLEDGGSSLQLVVGLTLLLLGLVLGLLEIRKKVE